MQPFFSRFSCCVALTFVAWLGRSAATVFGATISTVPVGNAGNAGDPQLQGTFGAVAYEYRIGKTEVTNAQYAEFLNAVAASDPYGLYNTFMGTAVYGGIYRNGVPGSYTYTVKPDVIGQGPGGSNYTYADKPIRYVSWYDAIRFANWLHNGQGGGDTEDGAYTILGGTPIPSNGDSITRNPAARWFLPNEDEWYKAAYYDPSGFYYDYPNGSDTAPNNNLPSTDTGNSANFGGAAGNILYPYTDAGAYPLSKSPYGTSDQGGNVWEWTETPHNVTDRVTRGGGWKDSSDSMATFQGASRGFSDPFNEGTSTSPAPGFRVASAMIIPEPMSLTLVLAATATLVVCCTRPRGGRLERGA